MPEEQPNRDTLFLGGPLAGVAKSPAGAAFEPGSRVGDYEIVKTIGVGGMGQVYQVRNIISDRIEAMKVLLPSLTQNQGLAERFTREIKVQAAMHHPNIAGLHTAFHFNNQLVMVMEYVEGVPLDERLRQAPIPLPECLHCIGQVLRALSYAHQHGVIHRDIKPSNIMLVPDGSVKLMDFGIANVAKDPKLTGTGVTVGSPYYMSPEQIQGLTPDARADIYSLGITLYEVVTGRRPINGDSEYSIMSAHLTSIPTPPIVLDHTLPAALSEIILMAIAKQPEQRFQTADAFLNALESVRAGFATSVPHLATDSSSVTRLASVAAAPSPSMPAAARPSQASAPKSHRGLYMALGAVAAIVVLAVAGLEAPKYFRTSAREQAPVPVAAPAPTPQPAPAPAPQASPAPAVASEPSPVPAPVAATQEAKPVGVPPARVEPTPVHKVAPPSTDRAAPRSAPVSQSAPAPSPQQQALPPAPAPSPQQQALPPAPSVSSVDLQKLEDRLAHLSSRMSSLDHSLQRLEQSQNASGLGMRSDFVQSRDMMHSFMGQAEAALRNQDIAAATRYLDRAEIQVDRLAKALNQ
jgi:serine/threonine-protein kinase